MSRADEPVVTGLPGVKLPPPIVQAPPPQPEPDDGVSQDGSKRSFRVGNTDVTISGDIRLDIGTGSGRRPR